MKAGNFLKSQQTELKRKGEDMTTGQGAGSVAQLCKAFCSAPPPQAVQFSLVMFYNFPCSFLSQLFVGSFPRGQSAPSTVACGMAAMVLRISEESSGVLFVPGTNSQHFLV